MLQNSGNLKSHQSHYCNILERHPQRHEGAVIAGESAIETFLEPSEWVKEQKDDGNDQHYEYKEQSNDTKSNMR